MTVAEEKIGGSTTWKQTFEIDRYGNRRFDASNTTTLGSCAQAICNPTTSTSNNRLTSTAWSYDSAGNTTNDPEARAFTYDAENHQKEVKDSQNNTVGQYLYDGGGRRVKKISATETTVFVYNAGGKLVAEYSTELAETQQVSYLTQDHLGSPRVITNENGAVVSRRDLTAFGEESVTAQRTAGLGYAEPEIRKNYTGYEKDAESGLEFAQARYYNPTHGRFTSVDPLTASMNLRNPQTLNRYSYVLNSPYKYTDPLGLIPRSSNPGGSGCGAEYSGCDSNGNGIGVDEHANRIYQTEVARMQANEVFARGETEEGWQIIRESEGDLMAIDQNGHAVEDPNQPTVEVSAVVNPPLQGDLNGPYIVSEKSLEKYGSPEDPVFQPLVGNGECPVLPQTLVSVGLVRTWREGAKVMGNDEIVKGTVIATFHNGRYANAPSGSSLYRQVGGNHAAIFLKFGEVNGVKGFWVVDQWRRRGQSGIRFISANDSAGNSNNADAFSIVMTQKPKARQVKRRRN